MRFDAYIDIKIALGAIGDGFAMLTQANRRAVINAGWDFQINRLALGLRTLTFTDGADFFRNFALALTLRANRRLLNIAKNRAHHIGHLAAAAALRAGFKITAR